MDTTNRPTSIPAVEADILARAGTHGIDTDGLKCYAFLFGMATVMIADANRTIERLERAAAKTEHACDECENLYDTQAEADACCTMQGARLDDEPCLADGTPRFPARKLTRQERLEGLADRGIDTWDEARSER